MIFQFVSKQVAIHGTLTVVSADNCADWAIGGFKALASAFCKCQYCMVINADMQTKVCNKFFQPASNNSKLTNFLLLGIIME